MVSITVSGKQILYYLIVNGSKAKTDIILNLCLNFIYAGIML